MNQPAACGIDVGGTAIKAVVVDAAGNILTSRVVEPTPPEVDMLVDAVAGLASELAPGLPVGVCVPGVVDEDAGIAVLSANLGWRDLPLRELLAAAIGREVGFGHDVRCGARAEVRWGPGSDSLLYLAIGTGLAAVSVMAGRPIGGLWSGEVGQLLVGDPTTGEIVSTEQLAGSAAIVERYREQSGDDAATQGAREIFAAAADGDAVAQRVISTALDTLASVVAQGIALLAPDRVVLAGGLSQSQDGFVGPLRELVSSRLGILPVPPIEASQFGQFAQAMGAAALVLPAEAGWAARNA